MQPTVETKRSRTTLDDLLLKAARLAWDAARANLRLLVLSGTLALVLWGAQHKYPIFWIPSSSMMGTLEPGDIVISRRLSSLEPIHRNQVVVFHPSFAPKTAFVKRVVGLPGDTLEMRSGKLFRNGNPIPEPFVRERRSLEDETFVTMIWQKRYWAGNASTPTAPTRDSWGPLAIPPGEYFVLGDNREESADSRYWGTLRRDQINATLWRKAGRIPSILLRRIIPS